jgi:hypothetical protein
VDVPLLHHRCRVSAQALVDVDWIVLTTGDRDRSVQVRSVPTTAVPRHLARVGGSRTTARDMSHPLTPWCR